MAVQYQTVVNWDPTLKDLEYTDTATIGSNFAGLVKYGVKITTGAPTATSGKFIPGAIISNAVTGVNYQNTGSTVSPIWTSISTSTGSGLTTDKISLTSADILSLNSVPIELIPAPGVGKIIQVISILASFTYGTTPYVGSTELDIYCTGSSQLTTTDGAIIGQSNDLTIYLTLASGDNPQIIEDASLMVTVAGGDPTDGDGTLDFYITYQVITL